MKKMLTMILVAVLLLSLCACTADPQPTEPSTEPTEVLCAAGHSWSDATCFFPKTCTVCAATEGKAAGHNWEKGVCTVCKRSDPDDRFLTEGAWMYITKQGWKVIEFLPDGTCEFRKISGMPKAAATAEECVSIAVQMLQETYPNHWEEMAERRFYIYKILDYYYCCDITREAVEYTVDGNLITLEQSGFLPMRLWISGRGKLVEDVTDEAYVNLSCTYMGNLLDLYSANN